MPLAASIAAVLASVHLAAADGSAERLLLCRPMVAGDPALARADALLSAAAAFGTRFLDYGVACDGEGEAARAARRAGLPYAVASRAEGRTDGSRFVLTLAAARDERTLERREVLAVPGSDAVAPLRRSLSELLVAVTPPPPRDHGAGPWVVVGAGAAAVAVGVGFALAARSAANDASSATTPQGYVDARNAWSARRTTSAVLLGVGAAAVAAGLTWRYAF